MQKPIPYGRQYISEEDIQEVVRVLKGDFITQGPEIQKFEEAFSAYVGSNYAVAVSNGTAALHLAVLGLGLKAGDKVISTPISFVASSNCARYVGAEVLFADIDPQNYLLNSNKVEELLSSHPKGSIKGIIPVDFAGRAVDLETLRCLADKYDCWILEDACHAPGGYFTNSLSERVKCGNGRYSDASIFSFHPVKHIASGEGGMITTNDKTLYRKLLQLRTHGITKDPSLLNENHGKWYYEMQELGYNYRLTDIQAALGRSQLNRADSGLRRRREIASRYSTFFKEKDYILGHSGYFEGHAYHLYVIEVKNRDNLQTYLAKHQIFAQVHYIPIHLMPYYKQFGWKYGDFPFSENYYQNCLSLPMFPTLSDSEHDYVIKTIEQFFLDGPE